MPALKILEVQRLSASNRKGFLFSQAFTADQVYNKLKNLFPLLFRYLEDGPHGTTHKEEKSPYLLLFKSYKSLKVMPFTPRPDGLDLWKQIGAKKSSTANIQLFFGGLIFSTILLIYAESVASQSPAIQFPGLFL